MPKAPEVNKVLVLGSGPIIIGQAAEFDYAGSQACLSLREEGIEVVLINSNPATIMTDSTTADRVYIEPLAPEFIERVIQKERPDSMLCTLGGQVGLNLAVELDDSGVLVKYGVKLLGTPLSAIRRAEDRQLFKDMLKGISEPVPPSEVVTAVPEALAFSSRSGYPVVVRPAFTLGGTGGGFAESPAELAQVLSRAFSMSPIGQALVEKSLRGWKEVEYEVMRDRAGNLISVCNMENIDPMGIHTGDSIVVAPSQTLTEDEYQMLRSAALKIIDALGIEGGCNVQFALDPRSQAYYVIEVNPRVSRSSALASKATGYPIARIAAKIAVGLTLDEITNPITGRSSACFEPALDYVVLKIPRWPFDKFAAGDRRLGIQMKATGEVMAIGRTFEAALMKAVRSLEAKTLGLHLPGLEKWETEALLYRAKHADDERLFVIAELLRRGVDRREIVAATSIDPWFVTRIRGIVELEDQIAALPHPSGTAPLPSGVTTLLQKAKRAGIADSEISRLWGVGGEIFDRVRKLLPRASYMMVDTCAGEFEAETPYYYSTYGEKDEVQDQNERPVVVIGSGPIRIGQGIEFDYCCVQAVRAFRAAGKRAVVINSNPETVSTDFSVSDRLYFEPLTPEDVLSVVQKERPLGVVLQFGGQTAINLAGPLAARGVEILGTSRETIDRAEDRARFDALCRDLGIPRPPGGAAVTFESAREVARRVGYPLLVRPSYVLGGRAMQVVHDDGELCAYIAGAIEVSPDHPVLVDKYIPGKELEVDAVSDGRDVLIPAIMEHIERAGVHSGDSIVFCPARSIEPEIESKVVDYTARIARALGVRGLLNAQFVVTGDEVLVIEANPRASRTVPFVTKVTGSRLIEYSVNVILGQSLRSLGHPGGLLPRPAFFGVKVPVFSWAKLARVDTWLGPEMKSTGEVMGVDPDPDKALYKALRAAGLVAARGGSVLITVADPDKDEAAIIARLLEQAGFSIFATPGTQRHLSRCGIPARIVQKLSRSDEILEKIASSQIDLVVNTLTRGDEPVRDGFRIRRLAVEHGVPCLTSLDTARALAQVMLRERTWGACEVYAVQDFGSFERRGNRVESG
jgi:carbamoyl-phosphate synthase large subunit